MLFKRDSALGMIALAASWTSMVSALDPDICATINTNDKNTFTDNLQTNGLCLNHCLGKAAFAITKGYDCWCSNYAPAKDVQVDLADCNFPCWGYPDEPCGGQNGEYSYVRLRDVDPSGTRGAEEPSSTSTKPSKTQAEPESSEPPSTSEEPVTKTEQSESESETTSSSSTKSSSSKQTSAPTSTAVQTVTADGTVKTVFIGPTEAPTSDGDSNRAEGEEINGGSSGGGGGVSKGALAGIVVGVALGVIAIVGIGLWVFFRRRRNQQQQEDYQEDPSIRGSSSGMMGSGNRPEMSMGGGSPGSPNTNSNRNSALMIDPRMDPFKQGLYVRSASHESINTLRDDHDYSRRIQQRTLRAMNPDPEPAG